jgi:hypothetical protein
MDGIYSNDAIYANLGGDPLYANVAEVRNVPFEISLIFFKQILLLSILLPSGEQGAGALGGAWSLGAGGQNG